MATFVNYIILRLGWRLNVLMKQSSRAKPSEKFWAIELQNSKLINSEEEENNNISHYDFRLADEDFITVAFDPKTDDLDSIYLKAAGNVIQHILTENGGNLRSAARDLGANHTTLSRILTKYNARCEVKKFPTTQTKFAVAA